MKYLSEKQKNYITIELINIDENTEYQANALTSNGEIMGSIFFAINQKKKYIWLRNIHTLPEYQNKGVGKALIDTMEYLAQQNRIHFIEGKFYPDNQYAKEFYLKNNYEIYKEEYETFVGKYLLLNNTNQLASRFEDFEKLQPEDNANQI